MGWRALVLSFSLMSQAAAADVLSFDIWPSTDPYKSLVCRIEIRGGQMIVVEVQGTFVPPRHVMRWPVRHGEAAAMAVAMAALIAGDLPSVGGYAAHGPAAPMIAVTWSTKLERGLISGVYTQSGLDLPPELARVVDTVMPGSACQGATQ